MKWPALTWFSVFVFLPLLIVAALSLASRGAYGGFTWAFSFDNFFRAFSWTYLQIFFASVQLALETTLMCLVLGVLMAWAMATSSAGPRYFYLCSIAVPLLANLVIRIYALKLFVGMEGPVQGLLNALGVSFDPFELSQNSTLVFYGMVSTYLPFMVFPLYVAFEKFDFTLVEAAQDLGASAWKILFTVILPNLKTAILSGCLLVFIPSLGEYIIPDLLGGAKGMLFGNLITEKFLKSRDWPLGAALAMILVFILFVLIFVFQRKSRSAHGS